VERQSDTMHTPGAPGQSTGLNVPFASRLACHYLNTGKTFARLLAVTQLHPGQSQAAPATGSRTGRASADLLCF
jgi:hypothetical protein